MALTSLDGWAFAKFVAAGTYFLRKYRDVLDDLNVFSVPDGDTGSNMYLFDSVEMSPEMSPGRKPSLKMLGMEAWRIRR